MNSIIISSRPKECKLIETGEKTFLIRKTYPKECLGKYYSKHSDFFREKPSYKIEPFKCYIYETKAKSTSETDFSYFDFNFKARNEHIIGEFICDKIYEIENQGFAYTIDNDKALTNKIAQESCLHIDDMNDYFKGRKAGYAWHITNLILYDVPKELRDFNYQSKCPNIIQNGINNA